MMASASSAAGFSDLSDSHINRALRLVFIIALHIAFFALMTRGLSSSPAPAPAPKTVYVAMVTPQAPPPAAIQTPTPPTPVTPPKPVEPPKPRPPTPKPKPTPKRVEPTPPPVIERPAENAIEIPAAPPQPAVESPPSPAPAQQPVTESAPSALSNSQQTTQQAPVSAGPPAAPVSTQPRVIDSGIAYLSSPQPAYPSASRRMGEEGVVQLRVLVDDRGHPQNADIHASSGSSRLDNSARQAVMRWRFKPHVENGRAVPVYAIVPIEFKLSN